MVHSFLILKVYVLQMCDLFQGVKNFFLAIVSKISVYNSLYALLWAWSETEYHNVKRVWRDYSPPDG